jgi:hypothetical protein
VGGSDYTAALKCQKCGRTEEKEIHEDHMTQEPEKENTMQTPKPIEKGRNSGNKYHRTIVNIHGVPLADVDVYSVLMAFDVKNPGCQHGIKKLLCAGIRGKGSALNDITESIPAVERAIRIEKGIELTPEEQNAKFIIDTTVKSGGEVNTNYPPIDFVSGERTDD